MGIMTALFGVILLTLSPDYFRLRLYERALPLVVLGVLLIIVGARLHFL